MSTAERLPWFKCYPEKLLNALAAMDPDEGYAYVILLLRIYDERAPIAETSDALARRTGLSKKRAAVALQKLIDSGKIAEVDGGLMNRKAAEIIAAGERTRDELSQAGKEGANRRWGNNKEIQSSADGPASQLPMAFDADLDSEVESTPPNGGVSGAPKSAAVEPKAKRSKSRAQLPKDWWPDSRDMDYASEAGFDAVQIRTMAEEFSDFHRARANTMADWNAAWRTWVRNQKKFAARRGGPPPSARPSLGDMIRRGTSNGR